MLDQNTDRMWYVIGAVLVGAAIILIANGTLPQMFASVTDSFENVSKEALDGFYDGMAKQGIYKSRSERKPCTLV